MFSDSTNHFRTWQENESNVQRTDAIIMTIANMVKDNTNVVPIIAPLNEYVSTFPRFSRCSIIVPCDLDGLELVRVNIVRSFSV